GPCIRRLMLRLREVRRSLIPCHSIPPLPDHTGDPREEDNQEQSQGGPTPRPFEGAPAAPHRPCLDRLSAQPALQILAKRLGAGVALVWFLVQALQANCLQVAVHPPVNAARRGRVLLAKLHERV